MAVNVDYFIQIDGHSKVPVYTETQKQTHKYNNHTIKNTFSYQGQEQNATMYSCETIQNLQLILVCLLFLFEQ